MRLRRRRQRNAHGFPMREWHGHKGCTDRGDLGPCDCLCHRDGDEAHLLRVLDERGTGAFIRTKRSS